jgi:hypothetical protein
MPTPPPTGKKEEPKLDAKRERFRRLAGARTNTVLKKLKVLGNCANRASYEYSREEVERIFKAIDGKIREIKARFSESSGEEDFKL